MKDKRKSKIRVIRLALVACDNEDFKTVKSALRKISLDMQRVNNDYLAHWLRLHYNAGNHLIVRQWMEADRIWAKTPKKLRRPVRRVFCPIKPCSPEMSRQIYHDLTDAFPAMGTKPLGLASQKILKNLTGKKAAKSAYPVWMQILAGQGEFPQSSHGQPIPFYSANSRLVVPQTDDEQWVLEVRLEKMEGERLLTPWRFIIKTRGKGLHAIRAALWNIAEGRWKLCASDLVERRGLWYAHVACEVPAGEVKQLNRERTAVLVPGRTNPVLFRCKGWTVCRMRDAALIRHVRRQTLFGRFTRQESYRVGSSNRRGHGLGRAMAWSVPLRARWLDFVKTWNCQLAAEVAKRCVAAGAGRLVIYQPTGNWGASRCLASEGHVLCRRDSTGWDWYQQAGQVQRVCEENGIKVELRRGGERRLSKQKQAEDEAEQEDTADVLEMSVV